MNISTNLINQPNRSLVRLPLLAGLVLAYAVPVFAGDTVARSGAFSSDGRIEIGIINGSVEIDTWDKEALELTAEVEGHSKYLEVSFDEDRLEVEYEGYGDVAQWHGHCNITLTIPKNCRVEIGGMNLKTDVRGLSGSLEVDVLNGNVQVSGRPKEVSIELLNGTIDVQGVRERVDVESVAGDIRLKNVKGAISAETVSGSIKVWGETFSDLELASTSGSLMFQGALTKNAEVDIETHSGRILMKIPANTSAHISAETFSGSILNALGPDGERKGRHDPGQELSFTLGSGSASVYLSAFSGTIEIEKLK